MVFPCPIEKATRLPFHDTGVRCIRRCMPNAPFFPPRRAGEKWLPPILLRCALLRKSQSFTDESFCLGPFAEMFAGIRWRMLLFLPAADVKNGSLDSRPPLPSLYPARVKVNRRGRHYIQNIVDEVASFVHRSRNRTLGFILAM